MGDRLDQPLHTLADPHRDRARDDGAQVLVDGADVRRDRHAVVVEHHDDVATGVAGVVHRFVRQPTREGAVAHDRDHLELLAFQISRRGDPERRREAGAGVPRAELVVRTLVASQEAGQAAGLTQRGEALVTAGEDLPRIALVADVPHDPVARRVEAMTQRHRQLDDAQPRADVAPRLGHHVDQAAAHLVGERLELVARQAPDILGTTNGLK